MQKFQHLAWYQQHHRLSRDHDFGWPMQAAEKSTCTNVWLADHVTQTGSINRLKVAMHTLLIRVVPIASERRPVRKIHPPTTYHGREMTPGRMHICTRNSQISGKVDRASGPHCVPIYRLVIIQGLYSRHHLCYFWCATPFAVFW